jgi:hypothetical protein
LTRQVDPSDQALPPGAGPGVGVPPPGVLDLSAAAESIVGQDRDRGESASETAPVAWLRMEMGDSPGLMGVRLKI